MTVSQMHRSRHESKSTPALKAKRADLLQREQGIVAQTDGTTGERFRQGIRAATSVRMERMAVEQILRDRDVWADVTDRRG